jgi:hypothetical protein
MIGMPLGFHEFTWKLGGETDFAGVCSCSQQHGLLLVTSYFSSVVARPVRCLGGCSILTTATLPVTPSQKDFLVCGIRRGLVFGDGNTWTGLDILVAWDSCRFHGLGMVPTVLWAFHVHS